MRTALAGAALLPALFPLLLPGSAHAECSRADFLHKQASVAALADSRAASDPTGAQALKQKETAIVQHATDQGMIGMSQACGALDDLYRGAAKP